MTDRELMQQALEALEQSRVFVTTREKIKHPEGTEWYDECITALRRALEQPAQQEPNWGVWPWPEKPAEQPAPVQEPLAWIERDMNCDDFDPDSVTCQKPDIAAEGWEWVPLYATPQPPAQQEPPAWWPAVENILKEYGLQAIDFVADFKAAQE